jgi:ComF family protein
MGASPRGWVKPTWQTSRDAGGDLLRTWRAAILDLLFPPCCAYCHVSLESPGDQIQLCEPCRSKLARQPGPFCQRCGNPLKPPEQATDDCPHCRMQAFRFDTVLPLGAYEADLRTAILRMKHFHEQPLAAAMGRQLAMRLKESSTQHPPDTIVPVPIHWIRRASRGTSSPEVMAESVAAELQVPLALRMLRCSRRTKKQSLLSPRQRLRNVRGAFRVSPNCEPRGLHIVLIDDIVTTGATASEAARILRKAGAVRVTVAVVARAAAPA